MIPETSSIRHIMQGQGNCLVAAAAMVGNVSYRCAAELRPSIPVRTTQIRRYLKSVTGVQWCGSFAWFRRIGNVTNRPYPTIAVIRERWWSHQKVHAVAICGNLIHDSNYSQTYSTQDYPRRNWRAIDVYYPANPELLQDVRRKRVNREFESEEALAVGLHALYVALVNSRNI